MSSDFKKVSVLDDRLMTTDSLNYGVFRGGQNVTNVIMPAISATPNALNFVVPFPSESTVLDREVYLRTVTQYRFEVRNIATNALQNILGVPVYGTNNGTNTVVSYACPLVYGQNVGLTSFPTHRSLSTIQVQINNNISTINCADVLPALLRFTDNNFNKNNMTASQVDRLASPTDEVAYPQNSNLAGYEQVKGDSWVGNGALPVVFQWLNATTPYNADGTPNPIAEDNATLLAGSPYFCMTVDSTEPLIAPPFIWNYTESNRMGIYGIQNLSVVCNYESSLDASVKFSFYSGSFTNSQALGGFSTAQIPWSNGGFGYPNASQRILTAELQMKYITPHGTDVKPLRNVIPYLEYPRFITSGLSAIDNATCNTANGSMLPLVPLNNFSPVQSIITPTETQLVSQTYTLNQVPDKLIIFVRPHLSRVNAFYNDFVLAIKNIRIQWNNHSGILANASQEQLFHMSREAGSNQDWEGFKGVANVCYNPWNSLTAQTFYADANSVTPLPVQGPTAQARQVATTGSYLVLDMARHLELQEPYYAPGSLGSFQLQFNLTVENYKNFALFSEASIIPEIIVIPVNSGIMVTEKGQTSAYSGILTKSDVLDAGLQEPYGHMDIKRIVGHGHSDGCKALPRRIHPMKKEGSHTMPDGSRMSNRLM